MSGISADNPFSLPVEEILAENNLSYNFYPAEKYSCENTQPIEYTPKEKKLIEKKDVVQMSLGQNKG